MRNFWTNIKINFTKKGVLTYSEMNAIDIEEFLRILTTINNNKSDE